MPTTYHWLISLDFEESDYTGELSVHEYKNGRKNGKSTLFGNEYV